MQRCSACDHIHLVEATQCERCGAALSPVQEDSEPEALRPPPGTLEAEVVELAATRGKIDAIKRYRQARNTSLKDAKEAVERLMDQYKVGANGRSGCAGLLLGLLIAGACGAATLAN